MLKFFTRRRRTRPPAPIMSSVPALPSVADTNPDLRIRNLLDDPGLRRAMGLPTLVDTELVAQVA